MKHSLYLGFLLVFLSGASLFGAQFEFEHFSAAKKGITQEVSVPVTAETIDVVFPFKNTGDQPITIEEIKTSCGCTGAKADKQVYQPGESGVITATYIVDPRKSSRQSVVLLNTDQDYPNRQYLLRMEVDHVGWTEEIGQAAKLNPPAHLSRVSPERVERTSPAVLADELRAARKSVGKRDERKASQISSSVSVTPTREVSVSSVTSEEKSALSSAASFGQGFSPVPVWSVAGTRLPFVKIFSGKEISSVTATGDSLTLGFWQDPQGNGAVLIVPQSSDWVGADMVKVDFADGTSEFLKAEVRP